MIEREENIGSKIGYGATKCLTMFDGNPFSGDKSFKCVASKENDYFRIDEFNLRSEPWPARGDFLQEADRGYWVDDTLRHW